MMFYEEIITFLLCVLPQVLATSCMPKCGIPSEWLSVASNVCYGTKDDNFGRFIMNQNCDLFAIRLIHVSGFQSHDKRSAYFRSRWGFNYDSRINVLLLKDRKLLIPKKLDDEKYAYYHINGFNKHDDVIIIKQNETLTKGQEFEIAYGLDFINHKWYENYVEGTHCVDVDVSCYV